MKKSVLFFGLVLSSIFTVFASEKTSGVDSDFLYENNQAVYQEWTGGYSPSEINTANQIKDIGRRLANGIRYQEEVQEEPQPFNKGNPAYKYSAARVYGNEKRGADILLIGETATVDTIKCLKMILQGYIENAYGYEPEAAWKLAEAVCYWNTNNFNNSEIVETFEENVKEVFAGYYTKTGLSEDYHQWKKSILLIPHIFTKPAVEEAPAPQETVEEAVVEETAEISEEAEEVQEVEAEETEESEEEAPSEEPVAETPAVTSEEKKSKAPMIAGIAGGTAGALALIGGGVALFRKKEE